MLGKLNAQDIHFSQVDANPLLLNPAYAGFFDGMGRFGLTYRNQWLAAMIPYQTLAVTGEMAVWHDQQTGNGLSVGGSVFADHAGELSYGSTSAHVSPAFYFALNRYRNNYLSLGFDLGWGQSGFDPSRADLDDPSEYFDTPHVGYVLVGLGAAWYYQPVSEVSVRLGVSARNVNRPRLTYLGDEESRLPMRFSIFGRGEWRRWQQVSIMPQLMIQKQGEYAEMVYGADVKWYMSEGGAHETSMRLGLAMRQADALITNLVVEYDAFIFTFCYDATVSDLASAAKGVGAMELGLVYRLARTKKKTRAIKCPIY